MQQLVLDPQGIVTEPNKLGNIPAGSLKSADELCIRSPGVLSQLPVWQTRATLATDAGTTMAFVIATPGPYMIGVYNKSDGWWYCWFDQTSGASLFGGPKRLAVETTITGDYQSIRLDVQPGFTPVSIGKQIFLNTYSNVLVWDTWLPTDAATATCRRAGIFPGCLQSAGPDFTYTAGTALGPSTWAAYVCTISRKVGDRLMVSAPSAPTDFLNYDAVARDGVVYVSTWRYNRLSKAGDIVTLYRTKSKPWVRPAAYTPYAVSEEVGSEYLKAVSYELTASDVAGGGVYLYDRTPDALLGEALYTNQSVGLDSLSAYTPPALRMITAYKGSLFGFDATYPPTINIRPTAAYGISLDSPLEAKRAGIGAITCASVNTTSGSPTITGLTTTETSLLAVGMICVEIAFSYNKATIVSVGSTSVTLDINATATGSSTFFVFYDALYINEGVTETSWSAAPLYRFNNESAFTTFQVVQPHSLVLSAFASVNTVTSAQPKDGFVVQRMFLQDARLPYTIRASRAAGLDGSIPQYPAAGKTVREERKLSAMVWSENNDPEAWPLVNIDYFSKGTPCAVESTKDAVYAFYTDCIWRISGSGGSAARGFDWRADPVAHNVTAAGTQVTASLSDTVYVLTSDGLVSLAGNSAQRITLGRVHDQMSAPPWTDGPYTTATAQWLCADEEHNEILMREPSAAGGRIWVYNTDTDKLTQTVSHAEPTHASYSRVLRNPLVVGRDGGSTWTIKTPGTTYGNFTFEYAAVYADNPFVLRQWQSIDIALENPPSGGINVFFNDVAANTVPLTATGTGTVKRIGCEVPRNAPAIGNTMRVTIQGINSSSTPCKILGVALRYTDLTETRASR